LKFSVVLVSYFLLVSWLWYLSNVSFDIVAVGGDDDDDDDDDGSILLGGKSLGGSRWLPIKI